MQKWRLCLLTSLLLCVCVPLGVHGEADLPYDRSTVLSGHALTEAQEALAEFLYGPLLRGEETIRVPEGTRYDDLTAAMASLTWDYPELFHLDGRYTVTYYRDDPDLARTVRPVYAMDAAAADAYRAQMYEIAGGLVRQDASPEGLHDALLARVEYADDGSTLPHGAAGALVEGRAVCEGYADALTLLYRMAGIPCGVIEGDVWGGPAAGWQHHAWNIAMPEGAYTLIDPTWNDHPDGLTLFFGLSTAQMAIDHAPLEDLTIPECVQYGTRDVAEYMAYTLADVHEAIRIFMDTGEAPVLYVQDAALYARIVSDSQTLLEEFARTCTPEELALGLPRKIVTIPSRMGVWFRGE